MSLFLVQYEGRDGLKINVVQTSKEGEEAFKAVVQAACPPNYFVYHDIKISFEEGPCTLYCDEQGLTQEDFDDLILDLNDTHGLYLVTAWQPDIINA